MEQGSHSARMKISTSWLTSLSTHIARSTRAQLRKFGVYFARIVKRGGFYEDYVGSGTSNGKRRYLERGYP